MKSPNYIKDRRRQERRKRALQRLEADTFDKALARAKRERAHTSFWPEQERWEKRRRQEIETLRDRLGMYDHRGWIQEAVV